MKTTLKQQCAALKALRARKRTRRTPEEAKRHRALVLVIDGGASVDEIAREFCVERSTARQYIYLYRTRRDPLLD